MDSHDPFCASSCMVVAGLTMAIGSIGPAFGQGEAVDSALDAIARSPTPRTASAGPCSWAWR